MAVTINADTSNGLVLTPDTSGEIKLQSAGTDIVSVTANGMAVDTNTLYVDTTNNRVGVGTSTPSVKLDVITTASDDGGQITGGATGANLYLNNTGTGGRKYRIYSTGSSSASGAGFLGFYDETVSSFRMGIHSGGHILIGTTTAGGKGLTHVVDPNGIYSIYNCSFSGFTANTFQYNGSLVGSIQVYSTSTAYNTSSDYRLKENVTPMSGSIDRLKQLKPSTWSWVQDGSHGEGFLAHEAQTVVPEAVTGTKDAMKTEEYEVTPAVLDDNGHVVTEAVMGTREVPDYQGIDQSKLVPLLTSALQEAITKIEDLETRIQALENA